MGFRRHRIVAALLLCSAASLFAVQDDEVPAIPHNPAAQQRRRDERLAWYRSTTVESYNRVGKSNPKWDADARRGLESVCRFWQYYNSWVGTDCLPEFYSAFREAVESGCDDPLIKYLRVRYYYGFNGEHVGDVPTLIGKAADALAASSYPPARKALALASAAAEAVRFRAHVGNGRADVVRRLDAAVTYLPEMLKGSSLGARDEAFELCRSVIETFAALFNGNHGIGFDKIDKALAGLPAARSLRQTVTGYYWIERAWAARGSGFANTVSDEQFRSFKALLEKAQGFLEEAWKLDSTNAHAASEMLKVAKGLGFPREEMETWFRRAVEADEDYYEAYAMKLDYLAPKWHGSVDQYLSFARACYRTGNWESGAAKILLAAHLELARHQRSDYLRQPEVRADIKQVFEAYLKLHPDSRYAQTYYARWSMDVGDFAEARRQYDRLGDKYWAPLFPTRADAERRYDVLKLREEFGSPNQ